ncbi:MAG: DUF6446 family protein [Paracoccaceae bacterium]|nr:DUF6446 family protein [Paracoccaceae bacterium]
MNGKIAVIAIVVTALLFGVGIYYTQEYAYYEELTQAEAEGAIQLTKVGSSQPEPIVVREFQGIDASSSPIRFRACFTTPQSMAMLTETYEIIENPVPLVAPNWFDCFDAQMIGEALERGDAIAFMGEHNVIYGVDRVVAVFPDGRGYAWHQLNECGDKAYDGSPLGEDCPSPEGSN